jgi:hypothetical protein
VEDQEQVASKSPSIVPCGEIPISSAAEHRGLEVRPFMAHRVLGSAVPNGAVALAWTRARPQEDVPLRSHSTPGLLIVLQGSAEFVAAADAPRAVERGDVITLPGGREYGFRRVGPAGLQALHVAFQSENAPQTGEQSSLQQLLATNERRVEQALRGPYFHMLRNGSLGPERCRNRFRDAARIFSDAFQNIMFARQATCRDEDFAPIFLSHLREELGHNELLTVTDNRKAPADAVLRATCSWFCHQMLMLDNVGKAVLVHLVLETAGYHFHTLAKPVLAADVSAGYFAAHSEADDEHKDAVLDVLQGLHPRTYQRLEQIVEDGWNMFDAMTRRIVHLVELEAASS